MGIFFANVMGALFSWVGWGLASRPFQGPIAGVASQGTPTFRPAPKPSAPAKGGDLAGNWGASPDGGTTIALSITPQDQFAWNVTAEGQSHRIAGQATYGNGVLTLVQSEGGAPMVGQVTWQDADHFVFQALGGGTGDPGLSFVRSP